MSGASESRDAAADPASAGDDDDDMSGGGSCCAVVASGVMSGWASDSWAAGPGDPVGAGISGGGRPSGSEITTSPDDTDRLLKLPDRLIKLPLLPAAVRSARTPAGGGGSAGLLSWAISGGGRWAGAPAGVPAGDAAAVAAGGGRLGSGRAVVGAVAAAEGGGGGGARAGRGGGGASAAIFFAPKAF